MESERFRCFLDFFSVGILTLYFALVDKKERSVWS